MALILEIETDLVKIAKALGSDVTLASNLMMAGVTIDAKPKSLIFLYGGGVIANAGISFGPLKNVLDGKGSPPTKAIMKAPFDEAMKKAADVMSIPTNFEPLISEPEVSPKMSVADAFPITESAFLDSMEKTGDKGMAKVTAIKVLRLATGIGLKEAKDQVEAWMENGWLLESASVAPKTYSAEEIFAAVHIAYTSKGKVTAIKQLRTMTGKGLKEAMDQVVYWAKINSWVDPFSTVTVSTSDGEDVTFVPSKESKVKVKSKKAGIMNTAIVPLSQATELYQPVKGSGSNSKYFAIAIGPELKVGVRVKSDLNISLRVEGDVVKFKPNLIEAKLDSASSGQHWSAHWKVESASMMRKSIAAVLASLNYRFDQFTLKYDKLVGSGA